MAAENFGTIIPCEERSLSRCRLRQSTDTHLRVGRDYLARHREMATGVGSEETIGKARERILLRIIFAEADPIKKDVDQRSWRCPPGDYGLPPARSSKGANPGNRVARWLPVMLARSMDAIPGSCVA